MQKQEYIPQGGKRRGRKPASEAASVEKVHKKNGYYDGKIFYAADKVTYTFVHDDAVMILHFDLTRQTLFLKGHRVTSLDFHPDLAEFLGRFRKCLDDNVKTKGFIRPFDCLVSSLGNGEWKSNR